MKSASNEIGPKLLELLGLPSRMCIRASIYLEAGKEVLITAEYFAGMEIDEDTNELKTIIRQFVLEEKV